MRLHLVVLAMLAAIFTAESAAFAQSASCGQLINSLRALTGNRDYAQLAQNTNNARQISDKVQAAESQFVRTGCQKLVNSNQRLTSDCRALARTILQGRDDYNKLAARVQTGQAVAQQRESVLQQIARFGCGTGSNATVTQQDAPDNRSPLEQFLDQIFGGRLVQNPYDFYGQTTLRTVCVRTCDGYYWPVSFSTLPEYLPQDDAICAQQCPGSEVALYYFHNPDEGPEQMVNLYGESYTALPTAFKYREEIDKSCSCKAPISYGSIQVNVSASDGSSRPTIQFGDLNFPLPLKDPRRSSGTVTVADYVPPISVPLPRRRPVRAGEDGPMAPPQLATGSAPGLQIIQSGQRLVRIVGPDTPYVQAAEEGS